MKTTLIALVVLVGVASAVLPTPQHSRRVNPFEEPQECSPGCSADCNSIVLCNGDVPVEIDCSLQTGGKKPYCHKELHQCVETSDHCTPQSDKCNLSDGFYPNLLDCRKFYYCSDGKKEFYNCEGTSVYNPKTTQCEFGISCYTFDTCSSGLCRNKPENTLIAHPLNKNLYVLCAKSPVLFKCPNGYEYDPTSIGCSYVCTAAGRFPDEANDKHTTYYECIKTGSSSFSKYFHTCPEGTFFTDTSGKGRCENPQTTTAPTETTDSEP